MQQCPEGCPGMPAVLLLPGISGLSFDSPSLCAVLWFCLLLLFLLSCQAVSSLSFERLFSGVIDSEKSFTSSANNIVICGGKKEEKKVQSGARAHACSLARMQKHKQREGGGREREGSPLSAANKPEREKHCRAVSNQRHSEPLQSRKQSAT